MPINIDNKIAIISEKKFNRTIHAGYDPLDVDVFFDDVIKLLLEIKSELADTIQEKVFLQKKVDELMDQVRRLSNNNEELKQKISIYQSNGYDSVITHQKTVNITKTTTAADKEDKH